MRSTSFSKIPYSISPNHDGVFVVLGADRIEFLLGIPGGGGKKGVKIVKCVFARSFPK
jgi:hypothetical protein